jgi:UDP-N-acetyl-D-glucosamine dehydrogenase
VFDAIVPVESAEAAELFKVYENTFRLINIALTNEMAQACDRLGVDVWGVIEAAATKPFGFMKFTPRPWLGGHCIPLDPRYLSWKMRTLAFKTRMIVLASEIDAEMPLYVVRKVMDALNDAGKATRGTRVLVLGIAYKRDVGRPAGESGAGIRLLQEKGAVVVHHDPHCPVIDDDGHNRLSWLRTTAGVDYRLVADHARIIVDTRGTFRSYEGDGRVVGLSSRSEPEMLLLPGTEVLRIACAERA